MVSLVTQRKVLYRVSEHSIYSVAIFRFSSRLLKSRWNADSDWSIPTCQQEGTKPKVNRPPFWFEIMDRNVNGRVYKKGKPLYDHSGNTIIRIQFKQFSSGINQSQRFSERCKSKDRKFRYMSGNFSLHCRSNYWRHSQLTGSRSNVIPDLYLWREILMIMVWWVTSFTCVLYTDQCWGIVTLN